MDNRHELPLERIPGSSLLRAWCKECGDPIRVASEESPRFCGDCKPELGGNPGKRNSKGTSMY